jgi:L-ascorbate metabolism protein UlaG (beta-lactamase superfamily)
MKSFAIAVGLGLISTATVFGSLAVAQGALSLSYLGTAGWEISDGKTVILVDPYLTRLKVATPNDPVLPEDTRPTVTSDDYVVSDEAVVDAHVKRANFILITHTHLYVGCAVHSTKDWRNGDWNR